MTQLPQVPEYIRSLVPYVPGKPIEETQRELGIRKVIKLASNENPLGPSPKGLAAAARALRGIHRYPDASAYRLKQALARHLGVSPSSLVVGNGSNEVIDMLIRTYCVAGDQIVTPRAAFLAYRVCAQIQGVGTLEAGGEDHLRADLDGILRLARSYERARIVFLANPNNPTGTSCGRVELHSFLSELARVRGGSVMAALDYAYWEYVTNPDLPDPLELQREFPNVVILRTFSKIYGLAGLRAGYGVAGPAVIENVEKVRQPFNLNSLALAAAEGALEDAAFIARSRKLNADGKAFWERELEGMGIPFWKSDGNFLLADVGRGLGKRGGDVYVDCLRKGVIFRPVANYGLTNALRITVGTSAENVVGARVLREQLPRPARGRARPRHPSRHPAKKRKGS